MVSIPRILLLIESSRTCEREFCRGIARYARLHGPWTFYHKPKFYLTCKSHSNLIPQIEKFNPDGIIVSDTENLDDIMALGRPTIIHTVRRNNYSLPMVLGDTQEAGRMGAEYLLGLGYKHYAYCGIGDYYWSRGRYLSFRKTIEQAGNEVRYYELNPCRMRDALQEEIRLLKRWLASLPMPLGLMTCADDCSQHIIEACRALNIQVPEHVGIIGVDNDEMVCELSNPPLSSIALNFETAGYQTAERLHKMVANSETDERTIRVAPSHVEVRASTDILAIDDNDVAAALRFIRENSNQLIQISDVLDVVACSQRTLYQKFLRNINRSVHQEIKRSRVEQIAKMLRETDLSLTQISQQMGYYNVNHISRYFKQEMGIKPLAYRKQLSHIN